MAQKIAICISGSLRSLEHCIDNFKKNIVDANNGDYDISLFCYIPNDINSHKISLYKSKGLTAVVEKRDDKKFIDVPNIQWRGRPKGPGVDSVSTAGLRAYLQQLYGIEQSFKLMEKCEKENDYKFDVIMRCRSDVVFKTPVNLKKYNLNNIIVPKFHGWDGINDRFAVGARDIMATYMKMFSRFYSLPIGKSISRAEYYCKINLINEKIPYEIVNDIRFNRIRMGGRQLKDSY